MLEMSRVIVFTGHMHAMEAFYRDILGLSVVAREAGWIELSAGGCTIALHKWEGNAPEGPIKIVFYSANVEAERKRLIGKGAPSGKMVRFGGIHLWDTHDPDGNAVQISSRRRLCGTDA